MEARIASTVIDIHLQADTHHEVSGFDYKSEDGEASRFYPLTSGEVVDG